MNTRKESFYLIVAIIALIISGCAITPPASETIMFQKQKPNMRAVDTAPRGSIFDNSDNQFIGERPYHPSPFYILQELYYSVSGRPVLHGELAYAKKKFASFVRKKKQEPDIQDGDFEIPDPYNLAIALPMVLKQSPTFSLAGKMGVPVLGADMTAKILKDTYLTTNVSWLSGELIWQWRLLDNKHIGLAVGPNLRLQRRWLRVVEGPDESFGISTIISVLTPARIFYNKTVGLRSVIYVPIAEGSFLHAVIAPGYVTNLHLFTINAGLSMRIKF